MVGAMHQVRVVQYVVKAGTPTPSFAWAVQGAAQCSVHGLEGIDFDEHSIACSTGARQVDQSQDDSPMGPT